VVKSSAGETDAFHAKQRLPPAEHLAPPLGYTEVRAPALVTQQARLVRLSVRHRERRSGPRIGSTRDARSHKVGLPGEPTHSGLRTARIPGVASWTMESGDNPARFRSA
jgi:hypothetical protein